jgi:outer membrane lipoprotein SlyB
MAKLGFRKEYQVMKRYFEILTVVLMLTATTHTSAQTSGNSVSLQYGTVKAVESVQAQSRHARGAILGGIGGAVLAHGHPGLGALAGGLIGGSIEGHRTGKQTLRQYTISLAGGGAIVIDTEQRDIVLGDCVVVEQGQYANIRRVSGINCQVKQQPEHHVSAAGNCQKAKDELNEAKTSAEVENAVIKVRTLCED